MIFCMFMYVSSLVVMYVGSLGHVRDGSLSSLVMYLNS